MNEEKKCTRELRTESYKITIKNWWEFDQKRYTQLKGNKWIKKKGFHGWGRRYIQHFLCEFITPSTQHFAHAERGPFVTTGTNAINIWILFHYFSSDCNQHPNVVCSLAYKLRGYASICRQNKTTETVTTHSMCLCVQHTIITIANDDNDREMMSAASESMRTERRRGNNL